MADQLSPEALAELLNLRSSEAETMGAVLRHCAEFGVALGGGAAVVTAGAGTIIVPGLGAVPGWLAGFAAGWASGTLACTMANRGIVIEALKQTLSDAGRPAADEGQAIARLRGELDRLRNPERPEGYELPGRVYRPKAGAAA